MLNTSVETENQEYLIYEASFHYDRVLVILDIIQKQDGKVFAYEVKSSLKISDTYIWDAALQYYVITNSGIQLEDFSIIYMKDGFQDKSKEEIVEEYFIVESVLERILPLQRKIEDQIIKGKEALVLKKSPLIDIGTHCNNPYPCDFIGHCWKHINEASVFKLDFLTDDQKFEYYYKGLWRITDLLELSDFNDEQKDQMRLI